MENSTQLYDVVNVRRTIVKVCYEGYRYISSSKGLMRLSSTNPTGFASQWPDHRSQAHASELQLGRSDMKSAKHLDEAIQYRCVFRARSMLFFRYRWTYSTIFPISENDRGRRRYDSGVSPPL